MRLLTLVALALSPLAALAAPVPAAEERGLLARAASVAWAPSFKNYNDWNCKSTDKAPVVLLHGLTARSTLNWITFGSALANDGYCVFTPQYGTRLLVWFGYVSPVPCLLSDHHRCPPARASPLTPASPPFAPRLEK